MIETKILYANLDKTIEKGLQQTNEYSDIMGADESHLILFNRDKSIAWDDKIWHKSRHYNDKEIEVWGC